MPSRARNWPRPMPRPAPAPHRHQGRRRAALWRPPCGRGRGQLALRRFRHLAGNRHRADHAARRPALPPVPARKFQHRRRIDATPTDNGTQRITGAATRPQSKSPAKSPGKPLSGIRLMVQQTRRAANADAAPIANALRRGLGQGRRRQDLALHHTGARSGQARPPHGADRRRPRPRQCRHPARPSTRSSTCRMCSTTTCR